MFWGSILKFLITSLLSETGPYVTPFSEKNKSFALPALKFPFNQFALISRTSPAFSIFSTTTLLPSSLIRIQDGLIAKIFKVVPLSFSTRFLFLGKLANS